MTHSAPPENAPKVTSKNSTALVVVNLTVTSAPLWRKQYSGIIMRPDTVEIWYGMQSSGAWMMRRISIRGDKLVGTRVVLGDRAEDNFYSLAPLPPWLASLMVEHIPKIRRG